MLGCGIVGAMEQERGRRRGAGVTMAVAYVAMIAATVGAFLYIRALGVHLTAPVRSEGPRFGAVAGNDGTSVFFHLLLALLVVIVAARLLGALFRRLQQPPVIGEVIAGILLGPSLLGHLAPSAAAYLLPPAITPALNGLAQVGVVFFMFLVGLELDPGVLRQRTHVTVAISHASIVAPFVLGSALALWLYPQVATGDVPFTPFALFMGVSMSVTAFPVLARILTDRGLQRTPLGVRALTCAAVDDVTAWCLLALVVSVARARVGAVLPTMLLTLAYIALMFAIVRPVLRRFAHQQSPVTQTTTAVALIALLGSALVTEFIGIHAVFGAFFLGAVIPHDSPLARDLCHKLEDLVVVLLLPAFFALTGMHTQIALVSGPAEWLICATIIAVACLGKFGGSTLAARLTGLAWRDAAGLGVLMNTRGLMELVVLNIGLDLHVISPALFAMMVLMALVTTLATTPLLHFLTRGRVQMDVRVAAAGGSHT